MMSHLCVTIFTIFPEMFPGPLGYSLIGKALRNGLWSLKLVDIRSFGIGKRRNVDDMNYGGDCGLVMRPDVLGMALDSFLKLHPSAVIYYPSPRGRDFNQCLSKEISLKGHVGILCGRFKGIDERVIDEYKIQQVSIGNYLVSGGEIAAFVIIDSVIRFIPGVILNIDTLKSGSFLNDSESLEYPLYTKPPQWRGRSVPNILLCGHHSKIRMWREKKSLEITVKKRGGYE